VDHSSFSPAAAAFKFVLVSPSATGYDAFISTASPHKSSFTNLKNLFACSFSLLAVSINMFEI
jgi:hypothetical protein